MGIACAIAAFRIGFDAEELTTNIALLNTDGKGMNCMMNCCENQLKGVPTQVRFFHSKLISC